MEQQSGSPNSALPEGTVTFLFTDIEGSTKLLHSLGAKYISLLADHHRILREVFTRWNGGEVGSEGDAFFISFPKATEAVAAVVEAQRTLADYSWPEGVTVRVRMGLHTGEPWTGSSGYVGMDVHRAARIAHVGYGGQVLLSETTAALLKGNLPEGVNLLDLGLHHLKDMQFPEHIRQLAIDGLPSEFPPLRSLRVVELVEGPEPQPVDLPSFLLEREADRQQPVFVGRERELAWLKDRLDLAVQNQGNIVFVTGEAGIGKSSLLQFFAGWATEKVQELLIAWGNCNSFIGRGDAYLPFRQALDMLSGDVELSLNSGSITINQARRLWAVMPFMGRAIAEKGQALAMTLVDGRSLLDRIGERVGPDIPWYSQLERLARRAASHPADFSQDQLYQQCTAVLRAIAAKRSLLLILDDLQWADDASLNLLFHLGRNLVDSRILIVGSFRPEEVALGRDGVRHPLEKVTAEFQRIRGDIVFDLDNSTEQENRTFVEALLDNEPNNLSRSFRRALLAHTSGQPLFTVETLRYLQDRGDLRQDQEGYWYSTEQLDWDALPVRIEGVIESRIGQLEESLRDILTVASVEGESFTVSVVAEIQKLQLRDLLRSLSRELETRYRLVKEREALLIGRQMLARYRFAHALFQRYLYNDINTVERRLLHQEIATVLEDIYGDKIDTVASQLARHYFEAGDDEKATTYLLMAGDQARHIYAHREAIGHYRKALSLVRADSQHERAARILMKIGLSYSSAFEFDQASESYEEASAAWQRASTIRTGQQLPMSQTPLRLEFSNPLDLDPRNSIDASRTVLQLLFSGLLRMTSENDIEPDLAARWEVRDSGQEYVFHLRSDVLWSDGQPVTAYDFEYAWRRILDPAYTGTAAYYFYDIRGARAYHLSEQRHWNNVGIRVMDESTLVVELEEPVGNFLQLVSHSLFFPVPRHVVKHRPDIWTNKDKLVTNGPFLLESWEAGKSMTLVRNPAYHGKVKGNIEQIEMTYIRDLKQGGDDSSLAELYETNRIEIMSLTNMTVEMSENIIARFADDYVTAPGVATRYIGLNPSRPPLDDVNFRRALAMSIDREAFARQIVGSSHDVATGGIIPPGIWGHSKDICLPFDPQQARALLDKNGYSREPDIRHLSVLYHPTRPEEMEFVVNNWRHFLTLKITAQMIRWSELFTRISGDLPDIYRVTWSADLPDPDNFLRAGFISLRSRWNHRQYKELITKARKELDQSRRLELCRLADKVLIDEAIVIPLVYERINFLVKPTVHRFSMTALGNRYEDIVITNS
jgi:ABC-type oligopeptide transport system substrate-binding subunit/class 3 adenylate cyclase/ABC-type dipeptide/oligopeptide/nickel transport system ATPase subunit